MKKVMFLISVDCDLRTSSVEIRDQSVKALLDLFAKKDVAGHITWFLNENDFAITHLHQEFLLAYMEECYRFFKGGD